MEIDNVLLCFSATENHIIASSLMPMNTTQPYAWSFVHVEGEVKERNQSLNQC